MSLPLRVLIVATGWRRQWLSKRGVILSRASLKSRLPMMLPAFSVNIQTNAVGLLRSITLEMCQVIPVSILGSVDSCQRRCRDEEYRRPRVGFRTASWMRVCQWRGAAGDFITFRSDSSHARHRLSGSRAVVCSHRDPLCHVTSNSWCLN